MSFVEEFNAARRHQNDDAFDRGAGGVRAGRAPALDTSESADGTCWCHREPDSPLGLCVWCRLDAARERMNVARVERGAERFPPFHDGRGERTRKPCATCAPTERAEWIRCHSWYGAAAVGATS